jgi:hypothetical protein
MRGYRFSLHVLLNVLKKTVLPWQGQYRIKQTCRMSEYKNSLNVTLQEVSTSLSSIKFIWFVSATILTHFVSMEWSFRESRILLVFIKKLDLKMVQLID